MDEARGVPWSTGDAEPPTGKPTISPPPGGSTAAVEQAIRQVAGDQPVAGGPARQAGAAAAGVTTPMGRAGGPPGDGAGCGCQDCAKGRDGGGGREEFVYALGRLDVRFPSIGVEREMNQRLASLGGDASASRGVRLRAGLEQNLHLARRMCYTLLIGGGPAYVVSPAGSYLLPALMDAVGRIGQERVWSLVIGRRGSMSTPGTCGGMTAPVVVCDQLYAFTEDDWAESLERQLAGVFTARRLVRKDFRAQAQGVLRDFIESTENLGASDAHRAVNYLLMQHPGLFLAVAERSGRQRLDKIETRTIQGLGTRRLVGVIASFIDPATGVPERLFTRVDVTEEWPFIADTADGRPAPIGLLPYLDNALVGAMY